MGQEQYQKNWKTSRLSPGFHSGYTLENAHAGDSGNKAPVPAGTYDGFVRADHDPARVELTHVPGYEHIQIHNGNYPRDFKGCFGVGNSHSLDFIGESNSGMRAINRIIEEDGTGVIKVKVGSIRKPGTDGTFSNQS